MKNFIKSGLLFVTACIIVNTGFLPIAVECKAAASNNPAPVPTAEIALPTEVAQDFLVESPTNNILEGAILDGDGNLLFCDISKKSVMRLSPDKKLSTLVKLPDLGVGGLALHKDGRLFMSALDLPSQRGAILAWSPATGKIETVIPVEAGFWPNDLVLAPDGGFYFSDFHGSATDASGGVYYVSPDFKSITPVIKNLAQANGVALSPDGKILWATEFSKNRLHRAQLVDATTVTPIGSSIPYHFIGPAPDSMRTDSQGNVYVAIYGQGRVMVFNELGIPIGQIILPGREKDQNLLSTSLAIKPDAREVFIVSSNSETDLPAKIFLAQSPVTGK